MTAQGHQGAAHLRAARGRSRGLLLAAAGFSLAANLLMLTGPLYMLLVYDRVLASRSVETLVALTVLAGFLFLMMGLLDHARARILARIGARFQAEMDAQVFAAVLDRAAAGPEGPAGRALRDVESVRMALGSAALVALFDLPWTPIFLGCLALLHPWLGALALAGCVTLALISAATQWRAGALQAEAGRAGHVADRLGDDLRSEAGMLRALNMTGAAGRLWLDRRTGALAAQVAASDSSGAFGTAGRTLRLFLQSAMLGLGALLVLDGALSPGAMVAGSILAGRALAPVEKAIGHWPLLQRAATGWRNLARLLDQAPRPAPRTALPRPAARLDLAGVSVVPPGQDRPALRDLDLHLSPGEAIGVIGPSGAGKTTLAQAVTGAWPPAAGTVRLDGAALTHYGPEALGRHIGYLPQRVALFQGTIAANIARFTRAEDAAVIAAARAAGAHETILSLPQGYDTPLGGDAGAGLSGGQIQRIALARALFGDPVLVVLDEPNSNLDTAGTQALNAAVRALRNRGAAVIVIAHRPSAIRQCDRLLLLEDGAVSAFGPREEVLRRVVRPQGQGRRAAGVAV